ncbi:sensor domain CHASE3-containing protein [Flexibacter flexilis DSM 6793]|uniref:Sensor domain CHASE3-containing protein n=1 Tax=Flexibacter flexilis DSM 6793 TaxID=927664 RepID=A0A1I1K2V8_9BACT|nr:CHASE3 domain-containing protein [Flexibacter flexilis]SFC55297.1 sensor domain CHASE3-containing protein [Flexibacter flexilis DSM 6793]
MTELNFELVWRKVKNLTIEILLAFSVFVLIVNTFITFSNDAALEENSNQLIHTYNVLQQVDALSIAIKDAETGQRGYLITGEEHYLQPYLAARTQSNNVLDNLKKLLDNPEQRKNLAKLSAKVAEKFDEMENSITARRNNGLNEAVKLVKTDKGRIIMDNIRLIIADMSEIETDLLAERNDSLDRQNKSSQVFRIVGSIFVIAIILFAIKNTRDQKASRLQIFENIDNNNRNLLLNLGHHLDITDEQAVTQSLITNLTNAINFISSVGEGKFDVEFNGLTDENKTLNQNTLAGSLVNMRDKLQQVAAEDTKRQWATEGVAHVGEILRKQSDNIEGLAHEVIINLVKYVKATQGGLFSLNDTNQHDTYIEMLACYAYDRTKYLQRRVELGEGLIGEAVAEGDTIYLTDIPTSYLRITSGLGGENPSYLLVVPLKINEQVFGAIELAAFHPFEEHQIAFVEKIGESIASTLSAIRINEQTKRLLADAQMQAEQMRAQEEEMRQNTEELQATQEESERRVKELLDVISDKERFIAQLQRK